MSVKRDGKGREVKERKIPEFQQIEGTLVRTQMKLQIMNLLAEMLDSRT